jgi:UDP-glucuronate 4-epimerase
MPIVVTGVAGFIGSYTAQALLARGAQVVGVDNLNTYYDVALKRARLALLTDTPGFTFVELDITDRAGMQALFARFPDTSGIVHLAAQAGVRFSMIDPFAYVASNVLGHVTMLECARGLRRLEHFVYASSSSVYGGNTKLPFAEDDRVDRPLSVYAATKRSDELLSHAYAHLYGVRQTGLRFFTVYGPWGRPDMAYYSFAAAIVAGEPITVYDGGTLRRDFTYIDDIITGVLRCLDLPPPADNPARLLNIGNHRSERVDTLVALLERELGRKAVIRTAPRPAADVDETFADVDRIAALTGFAPATPLAVATWFRDYYQLD